MANVNRNRRVCPAEHAGMLDNFIRRFIHNPDKILKNYVKVGMTVLDIGCGPGLFTIAMARMVGEQGKVIAADLQEAMLDKLRSKITGSEIEKRVELHRSESDKISVSEKVDFALAFYMVHEVPDQVKFFREIESILNPGGKILVIEPKFHVSEKDFGETIKVGEEAGLKIIRREKILFSRTVVLGK